ncbi:MAG TPA: threonine ammonia-lyase [Candidatus Thermoplasmatota archaeon]|nr:threonine ammonia-lyase [Candidatus Thermoplasmatota archaeon]
MPLVDIEAARARIQGIVHRTPLSPSASASDLVGADVHLKLENLQRTGSFKVRGAANRILTLPDDARRKGVVAASAGNHAQGVALAARSAGIPSWIVMPKGAPLAKAEAVRGYGAILELHGRDYNEAESRAFEIQKDTGAAFVHAFDDAAVIAGQGTIGLEIVEDLPDVDTVVVAIGGGGLISGIASAVKELRPRTRVVGVVPDGAASLPLSLRKGEIVTIERTQTIADGLATRRVGRTPFDIIRANVDEVAVVTDDDIAAAILFLLERAKNVVEGAGAAALAALLAGKVRVRDGEKIAVVVSGGNIDVNLLDTIIQRGLAMSGRRLRLATVLPDRPGALADLLALVADVGANIHGVEHDRGRVDVSIGQAEVALDLDTRGPAHVDEVLGALKAHGYPVRRL